jgi:site-specific recombinase XerD
MDAKPRLLDLTRNKLRAKHYSYRTEQQYLYWIRRYVLYHGKRHPAEMSGPEVEQFLTDLAVNRRVSASTQNQALAAVLFLYRYVLEIELPWLENVVRARMSTRVPVVLPRREVQPCSVSSMGNSTSSVS